MPGELKTKQGVADGERVELATESTGARPRRFRWHRWNWPAYVFVLPAVLFCVALLAYPVLYSFALSFRDATVETFVSGDMPFVGLAQYQQVTADPVFWKAMTNTIVFTFLSILFQFTIGFLLALYFQLSFRFRNICLSLLLIPWVTPILTSANVFKGLFNELGPVNQFFRAVGWGIKPWLADPNYGLIAVIVANIWIGFPFNFVLLYAGIRAIPQEIYEAAKLDGASYWGRVFHITVPILKPVTIAVLMLGTIYTVKVFDIVWIMTGGGPANGTHLVSTYAYQTGFSLLNFGQAAAVGAIIVLLILTINLVQFLLQRIL
jgi:multiple sugar transport system permease protein